MFGFFNQRQRSDDRLASGFRSISERAYIVKEIPPGGMGRLRYQGGVEWNACTDDGESIPVGTEVILLNRRGTTWLVVPVYQSALLTVS